MGRGVPPLVSTAIGASATETAPHYHGRTDQAQEVERRKGTGLEAFGRKGLVSLLGELYDANVANRRFLHSRLTPGSRAI